MKHQAIHHMSPSQPPPLPSPQPRRSLEEVRRARRVALLDLYSAGDDDGAGAQGQDRRQGIVVVNDVAGDAAHSQEQARRLRIIACLDEVLRISAYFTNDRRAP